VIESGRPFTDDCRQRLDRIPWNRAKKHRRLRLSLRDRLPPKGEAVGLGGSLGRGPKGAAWAGEGVAGEPGGVGITCGTCGKVLILAEEAAYGCRCEDCWAGAVAGVEVHDSATQVQGISVDQVQRMLSPAAWEVECRLAAGQTYADVARDRGVSPDALKVRAGRWRARIRHSLALLNASTPPRCRTAGADEDSPVLACV
jgi:hypothetical protein